MIKMAPDYLLRFIDYLNTNYPTEQDCFITFLHGEKCVEYSHSDSEKCVSFAEYDKHYRCMEVPTQYTNDKSPRFLLESIAHEYWHHVQNCEGRLIDENRDILEKEAERKAIKIVDDYLNV